MAVSTEENIPYVKQTRIRISSLYYHVRIKYGKIRVDQISHYIQTLDLQSKSTDWFLYSVNLF